MVETDGNFGGDTDTDTIPTSRVRGLSRMFEPEDMKVAARIKRVQSVVAEKFEAFSEDEDESIIIKVASDSWQIGFAGEDAPK
jgi:hypothetical protein